MNKLPEAVKAGAMTMLKTHLNALIRKGLDKYGPNASKCKRPTQP